MRILTKNSIINRLSLSSTVSGLNNNTFLVVCFDNIDEIKFFKNIIKFKHSSILRQFKFSDAYICFLNVKDFFSYLKICFEHLKSTNNDGVNMILGFVYNGIFINFFNVLLIEKILFKYKYNLDFQNYILQLIIVIIFIIEVFIFSFIDLFLLNIENFFYF